MRRTKTKVLNELNQGDESLSDRGGRTQKKISLWSNSQADGMNQPVVELVYYENDMDGGTPCKSNVTNLSYRETLNRNEQPESIDNYSSQFQPVVQTQE